MSIDMRSFINFVRSARFGRLCMHTVLRLAEFYYLFRIACAALPATIHDDSIFICMLRSMRMFIAFNECTDFQIVLKHCYISNK